MSEVGQEEILLGQPPVERTPADRWLIRWRVLSAAKSKPAAAGQLLRELFFAVPRGIRIAALVIVGLGGLALGAEMLIGTASFFGGQKERVEKWTDKDGAQIEQWYLGGERTTRKITQKDGTRSEIYYEMRGGENVPVRGVSVGPKGSILRPDMECALAPSGSLHGECKIYVREDGITRTTREWYWYGDEVTEGEWHLRNK